MRSMIRALIARSTRALVVGSVFFLPNERRIRIERWLRGREDFRKLREADCVVVSFGKSGRTWLRVMLSRFFQLKYGLSGRVLLSFDNLYDKNRAIPKVLFTHDNYLKDYTKHVDSKVDFYDRNVVLLVRHPADVAVSQFHQWRYRMRRRKKALNEYPAHGEDISILDFVMRSRSGLPKVVDWMNAWAREIPQMGSLLVVRYEDMRADPGASLARILEFMGTPGSDEQVRRAVEFGSVENMRRLEQKRIFRLSGDAMVAKDRDDPNTYKVRRAKVGGYRDYFSDREAAEIDDYVAAHLSPVFGYGSAGQDARIATATSG